MYAIVNIAGVQTKVTPNSTLRVPLLETEVGGEFTIDQVLLFHDGKSIHVGQPFVEGRSLKAEVTRHGKDKKVIVFKKKRRKKYRRKNGHRQAFTEIRLKGF